MDNKDDKDDKNNRIFKIQEDTILLHKSMEILNEIVKEQEDKLDSIEDEIKKSYHISNKSVDILEDAQIDLYKTYKTYFYTSISLLGATILYIFL